MKVLLIGGTGVISTEVCKTAIEEKHEVYILNRGRRKDSIDKKANLIIADIRKNTENEIKRKINGIKFDVVVDFLSYHVDQLIKTLNCIDCNQYIFISSASIYDEHDDNVPYKESDAKGNKGWSYCADKYNCELTLEKIAEKKGIKYTIIRPYVTYNKTRFPYQIAPVEYYTIVDRLIRERPIAICENEYTTVTDAQDFACGVVGLFGNSAAYNEDFHITTDKVTTWKHIAELLAEKYGVQCKFVTIPKEVLNKVSNTVIDISEIVLDKARNMRFDNSKIKGAVPNFNADKSIDDSIEGIYKYFQSKQNTKINYLWAGCFDRMLKQYSKDFSGNYKFQSFKDRCRYNIGYSTFLCRMYLLLRSIKQKTRGQKKWQI